MIETSSNLPWKPSTIFHYLRKSLEIFRECCETFKWPSDKFLKIFGKWSEIFRKSSKMSLSVCLYDKQNNRWLLVDMEYLFSCSTLYLTPFAALVRYWVEHWKRYSISTHVHVLSSMYISTSNITNERIIILDTSSGSYFYVPVYIWAELTCEMLKLHPCKLPP